ncbi:unnamed protein product [Penicillium roqueforti FM164]|uniref:Uncharacterized protein n=1 Tax=Penicillium roqueforti (strain FM164) TaxID=1365484 RepID=W6QKY2_PENRF|nr:unnamed protein product [Penicillium roqueforti FM164]
MSHSAVPSSLHPKTTTFGPSGSATSPSLLVGMEVLCMQAPSGDHCEGLPTVGSFVLYKMEPLLKEKEDLDIWMLSHVRYARDRSALALFARCCWHCLNEVDISR